MGGGGGGWWGHIAFSLNPVIIYIIIHLLENMFILHM